MAHGFLSWEDSDCDPTDHRETVGLGLRRSLSDQDKLEVCVAGTTGRWEGRSARRTSVTLMYSREVDEQRYVTAKVGHSWGEEGSDDQSETTRVSLGYAKPI